MIKRKKEGKLEYYEIDDEKMFTKEEIERANKNLELLKKLMDERRIVEGSLARYTGVERTKGFQNEVVASEYLIKNQVYKVIKVWEGDYITFVELKEYPGILFNSIDLMPVKN